MIDRSNCEQLGMLVKAHGKDGSLLLRIANRPSGIDKQLEFLLVEIDGLLVPFFIEFQTPQAAFTVVVKLTGVSSRNQAEEMTGLTVYIPKSPQGQNQPGQSRSPGLTGYMVRDINKGNIGQVTGIMDVIQNPLMKVMATGKEYLIPMHKNIVLKISKTKKTVTIRAPEGLLDL